MNMGMAVITERRTAKETGVGLPTKKTSRALEVALDTERVVVRDQQLVIRRTMRRMAARTAFFGAEMLEDKGPLELSVTFVAARILAMKRRVGRRLAMN